MGETLSIRRGPEAIRKKGAAANRGALFFRNPPSFPGGFPSFQERDLPRRVTSSVLPSASALPPGQPVEPPCCPREPQPAEAAGAEEAVPSAVGTLRVRWMRPATNPGTETNTCAFLYAPFLSEFIRCRIKIWMAYAAKYSTSLSRCNCFLRPFPPARKTGPSRAVYFPPKRISQSL